MILLLAKTDEKIRYILQDMKYYNYVVQSVSNYEEFSAVITGSDDNKNNWVFCPYREKQDTVTQFKFYIWSKTKFEFGMLPEPNPLKNCGYSINGIIKP